jgi:photosynthetic reaction center cytochrome c subunit
MITFRMWIAIALAAVVSVGLLTTFTFPPVYTVQRGFRGDGQQLVYNPASFKRIVAANQVPPADPPQDPLGQKSSAVYQNVQVLGNLDAGEFLRLMAAITAWVAPEQGCNYCHNAENLADDSLYTKRVARRMLQMVEHINSTYATHVQGVGVTCYTCHRGNPVPKQIWFADPGRPHFNGMVQEYTSKNHPNPTIGDSSLPADVFTPFLEQAQNIRVSSTTALPGSDRSSIKQTDWTYGLMIHFSNALGVNCNYCHNSRLFADWTQSSPQRLTAWYGIRMVRDLNNEYLDPLAKILPHYRLSATGDGPKVNCATCHQGVYKPLLGVTMLDGYPELAAGGPVSVTPAAMYGEVPGAKPPAPGATQ